jgi:hypothetical protein
MNTQFLSKARLVAAGLVVCGVFVGGCSGSDVKAPTTQSPQAQATAAMHALLATFASIPGAHVANAAQFNDGQAGESWNVDASAASAFTAAAALLPRWHTIGGGSGGGAMGNGQYGETVYTTGAGTLATETVNITLVPRDATTSTLQVAVNVEYRLPKPATEHVPDSNVLTVTLRPVAQGVPGRTATEVITSRTVIAQVAGEINALPAAPRVVAYCPAFGPKTELVLDFASTSSAPASASTIVEVSSQPTAICTWGVQMSINGVKEPELDDSVHAGLFAQLEQLTGITH